MVKSPVIIIGMHRSGTTLLCKLLEQLGLFVGEEKRKNFEAVFFQRINKWVLAQANTTWDNTSPFAFVNEHFFEQTERVARARLNNGKRRSYLGIKKSLKYGSLENLDFPWAWKDPTNSITLDLWMRIFPEAKIIHIHRNPLDVAKSLQERERKRQQNFKITSRAQKLENRLSRRYIYNQSYRVEDLREGIKLWEEYVSLNIKHEEKYKGQIMRVSYEDLLDKTEIKLKELSEFVGLSINDISINNASTTVNNDRKLAFTSSEELMGLYEELKETDLMKKLGYDKLEIK